MTTSTLTKSLLTAAVFGAALAATAGPGSAADEKKFENCYGVAAAGKNDCATATHSCAGHSKVDGSQDDYVTVSAGLCAKLAGGSLESRKN